MGNGANILAGPVDVFLDPDQGTDFVAANQINFTGEAVALENQPELFQLAVDQRSTHIRQTLARNLATLKLKIEEATLKNLMAAFPFAQDSSFDPGGIGIPSDEVWVGISDGNDQLKFFSVLLQGLNPKGQRLEIYIPRAIVRGTSSVEYKRDATQGIPIEIVPILPNECDNNLLGTDGDFDDDPGAWTLGVGHDIDGGQLDITAAVTSTQDFASALFPRSGGTAGAFKYRWRNIYRALVEVSAYTDGGIDLNFPDVSPVTMGVNGTGIFTQDVIIDADPIPGSAPTAHGFSLISTGTPTMTLKRVAVYPLAAMNFHEYDPAITLNH